MGLIYDANKMGNWHHDVQITASVRTKDLSPPYYNNHVSKLFVAKCISNIYKEDLKEKTILDCACNAGGSLFELQKIGIKAGMGFDVRQMWVDQANWLKNNIDLYNTDNLNFTVSSLSEFTLDKTYDVSLFNGLFYHLANPVMMLEKIASITNDTIVVDTAYCSDCKSDKPSLVYKYEGKSMEEGLTGVEGISWLPNGEQVIIQILKALNFKNFKVLFKRPQINRLCVIASKLTRLPV